MNGLGALVRRWLRGRRRAPPEEARAHEDEPGEAEPARVVDLPIEDEIDLHGFRPEDTREVVDAYLCEAHRKGHRDVRIVHGKGRGVQRRVVEGLLERHPLVHSFRTASAARGGWGATMVRLLPSPREAPASAVEEGSPKEPGRG